MSIKPVYADMILKGYKKYEFRKHSFLRPINKVLIYSTKPIGKIVGYFTFDTILKDTPIKIWEMCSEYGGVSKGDFFNYFKMVNNAYAMRVNHVFKYVNPISPFKITKDFKAPHSFFYLESSIVNHITGF